MGWGEVGVGLALPRQHNSSLELTPWSGGVGGWSHHLWAPGSLFQQRPPFLLHPC